jgi:hypothetical protein
MPGTNDIRVPGDKLEIEGVVQPLCDEQGRDGICVEDASKLNKYNEPTSIAIGSDYANSCSTVYDWLDETLSHYYLWDTEVTVRITVEVLAVNRKPTR